MTSARSEPGELGGARGDHRDQHLGRLHLLSTVALSSCLSGLLTTLLTQYVFIINIIVNLNWSCL